MTEKNTRSCSHKESACCNTGCSKPNGKSAPLKSAPLAGSPMDTQIFKLGLGVLPTSVYIIIAALQSDGVNPSLSSIAGRWHEKPQALETALSELQSLNIIVRHLGANGEEPVYLANPAAMWAPNNED